MSGAAIECRISAEDPAHDFAPSTGKITELIEPGGIGVRVDSGIYEGFNVPIYYDPLIAKLLAWAPTRRNAIKRMHRALSEYTIRGIETSIPFHLLVMEHPRFLEGDYDTTFIDRVLGKIEYKKNNYEVAAISAVLAKLSRKERVKVGRSHKEMQASPWKIAGRQAMMRRH
jgi:acetyl/propionyl-CoA carboxylase alpha subunit